MNLCDQEFREDLLSHVRALSFPAFLQVIAALLTHLGFEDVKASDREHWMGRHHDGGCDLTALLAVPGGYRKVIIQAKQYPPQRPVFRRMPDELRGVCLRSRASEGVLITTSTFSDLIYRRRLASEPVAPVRLIDGEELCDLLALHGIGVWEEAPEAPGSPARRGVDDHFFAELEEVVGTALPDALQPVLPMRHARRLERAVR